MPENPLPSGETSGPATDVQTVIRNAAKAASQQWGPDQYVSISMAVLDALRSLPVEQRMEVMGMVRAECRWCGIDPDVAAEMTGECVGKDDDHLFVWIDQEATDGR